MSADMDAIHYVVIGIGINTGKMVFDKELTEKADSLYHITGELLPRRILISSVMKYFEQYYEMFCKVGNLSLLLEEYEEWTGK